MKSTDIIKKIEQDYQKKYPNDLHMKYWTAWYAEGHYDCIFNGGHCDDGDEGKKAKFLYGIIKSNLKKALLSKYDYIKTFAQLINNNKDAKIKKRRFEIGDVVGTCSDCMAEFKITGFEKKGYKAKCISLHHPNPKKSILKLNQEYFLKDSQIITKLTGKQ